MYDLFLGTPSSTNTDASATSSKLSVEDTYKSIKRDRMSKQNCRNGNKNKQAKTTTNINVQIFKNSEKLTNLRKKLAKLKDSLCRNIGYV